MIHSIVAEGYSYRLRPITIDDSSFVVSLRTHPELNKYINSVSGNVEEQENWIIDYEKRQNDYYFVVERKQDRKKEGLISVYDIDSNKKEGEWGRWVLSKGSLAAVESVWLLCRVAFDELGLNVVYSRTISDNKKVISFHNSCGFKVRKTHQRYFRCGSEWLDAIEHVLYRKDWPQIELELNKMAKVTSNRILGKTISS
ncbi:MAG: GNAT family N-acetyltransferase [Gammaproteobacteria bacterium]|nr:GNAT family N-acetyltransferase [Gammaproteobacteria bacterium]MDH5691821.1 GNAT family N-acetyltransferase [Gammaproteobacteria bacterium]